jgi:hypothetical protein
MYNTSLKVQDMPEEIRKACLELGHKPDDELTIKKAISKWTEWRVGDKFVGQDATYYIETMANTEFVKSVRKLLDEVDKLKDALSKIADLPHTFKGDWYHLVEQMCILAKQAIK